MTEMGRWYIRCLLLSDRWLKIVPILVELIVSRKYHIGYKLHVVSDMELTTRR